MKNSDRYAEFGEVINSVKNGISDIQLKLNDYQNEKFAKKSPEFFCLELNGEAGELANVEKKHWKGRDIPKERFDDEAADVFIALMNYANARGINLAKAIAEKLEKIENKRLELEAKGEKY